MARIGAMFGATTTTEAPALDDARATVDVPA